MVFQSDKTKSNVFLGDPVHRNVSKFDALFYLISTLYIMVR